MKKRSLLLLILLLLACSSHAPEANDPAASPKGSHPKLTLRADPRQGFAPMNVTFHAQLLNVNDTDKEYYCLKEEWEFGDGALSSQKRNCEPLAEGAKIETDFIVEHEYQNPGTYVAGFTLGEKKIRSSKVSVTVLQNVRSPNDGQ
jgi:hypothetical protein